MGMNKIASNLEAAKKNSIKLLWKKITKENMGFDPNSPETMIE
jgi:hypothetical protein